MLAIRESPSSSASSSSEVSNNKTSSLLARHSAVSEDGSSERTRTRCSSKVVRAEEKLGNHWWPFLSFAASCVAKEVGDVVMVTALLRRS